MVELLICVRRDDAPDLGVDVGRAKVGDVIAALPDGATWGRGEMRHPDWRIVALPDELAAEAEALLSGEVDATHAAVPPRTLQYRGFCLDLTSPAIAAPLRAFLADSSRRNPRLVVRGKGLLAALKTARAPVADPNVIGTSPTVIG